MPKANAELFALTYGSLVTELVRDHDDIDEINSQLDRIGHSIGVRCVDEFLSKAEIANITIPTCQNMRDTAEVIARIGFRMFLGVSAEVANFSPDGRAFSLFLYDNPLAIFVELPPPKEEGEGSGGPDLSKIKYSNIYCGVIRGALEQVNMRVECQFVRDALRGEEVNEIRVELKEVLVDGAGDDYKEE
uniref:Trafficking protein particle complex subunit n=1 Tax=Odontella aurita TaxID=265563 RepID=A0A7S4K9E3_9STRA